MHFVTGFGGGTAGSNKGQVDDANFLFMGGRNRNLAKGKRCTLELAVCILLGLVLLKSLVPHAHSGQAPRANQGDRRVDQAAQVSKQVMLSE